MRLKRYRYGAYTPHLTAKFKTAMLESTPGGADHRRMSEFLTGRVLIAMPGIDDPRFERAVVLVCSHSEDHGVGLALNRPVPGMTAPDLLERLKTPMNMRLPADPVLFGGPVDRERGFVVHTDDYYCETSSLPVCQGVAMTAAREVLEVLGDQARRPRRSFLALGYAGWGAGQLEREIQDSVWLTCEPDDELLFGLDFKDKWARALAKIGVSAASLSTTGGRA